MKICQKKEKINSYVDTFYDNVKIGNFENIYSDSSNLFKNEVSYKDFKNFMNDNNLIRGRVLEYQFIGIVYKIKKSENLYVSSALFKVTYEKQITEETFTFLVEREPSLAYYYIKPISEIDKKNTPS